MGAHCERCAKATGKEEMCDEGRGNYEAYIISIIGQDKWDEDQRERARLRKLTADDDAAHPDWYIEKHLSYGAIWIHGPSGKRRGVGLTGRPWFEDCPCAACRDVRSRRRSHKGGRG
jgi:hypothetical protein